MQAVTEENTRRNTHIEVDLSGVSKSGRSPPRRQRKKVRISDPGPETNTSLANDNATGLTPGFRSTSIGNAEATDPVLNSPTRRRKRRQSAPLPQGHIFVDPILPTDGPALGHVVHVQFTPIRQKLDERTRRRISRSGLSDETNKIEQEKRAQQAEVASLKKQVQELTAIKDDPDFGNGNSSLSGSRQIAELEAEIQRLRQETSAYQHTDVTPGDVTTEDIDTIMVDDSSFPEDLVLSHSPILRPNIESQPPQNVGSSAIYQTNETAIDASAQVSIPDINTEAEMLDLSAELEAARKEKRALFMDWKAQVSPPSGDNSNPPGSPPPEFMSQIVPTLKDALIQATDAWKTLNTARDELSNMGFSGSDMNEAISHIRQSFRSTRTELDRMFPGEISANVENGNATLAALIPRLKQIGNALLCERKRNESLAGTEKALRGQFDTCLRKYEDASTHIKDLGDRMDESAGDMLRARMKIQELEQERDEKDFGIARLKASLSKYHEDVQDLESIISKMEAEKAVSESSYTQQICDLESQVAVEGECRRTAESLASEREKKIAGLQATSEEDDNHIRVLVAKVESLEKQLDRIVGELEQKAAQEIGSLNARLAEKATALENAKLEIDRFARRVSGLEKQVRSETDTSEKMMQTITRAVHDKRRITKVNAANWQITSDGINSEPTLPGSEPFSLVRASTFQFENVRVGRGKDRKSLDSGIGGLTEESDFCDDGDNTTGPFSDFEIAEPAADPEAADDNDGEPLEAYDETT